MTIQQMINQLEKLKKEYGNVDVYLGYQGTYTEPGLVAELCIDNNGDPIPEDDPSFSGFNSVAIWR